MSYTVIEYALAALATIVVLLKLKTRLELSFAKHRSLVGHARMARRMARLVPFWEYDEERFFRADGAPAEVAATRQAAFQHLAADFARRFATTVARTEEI